MCIAHLYLIDLDLDLDLTCSGIPKDPHKTSQAKPALIKFNAVSSR